MKVERSINEEGNVGVLYSPGYGAGWSTWCDEKFKEFALFDKTLVEMAIAKKSETEVEEYVTSKLGEEYFYAGGWRDIEVKFVSPGLEVIVGEYDGNETIYTRSKEGFTA